jgi:hypothetical protein
MHVIILEYWGYESSHTWYKNAANHALKSLAHGLIKRLIKRKTLGAKRMAYRAYFTAYKRTAHYKIYPGLFSKDVQDHIWSYAHYIALKFGYDLEELENDWVTIIQGTVE